MQIDIKQYNPEEHDLYKGLTVKQPYADLLTQVTWQDEDGNFHADKEIEVRSRNISYRGDILICSSQKPVIPLRMSGVTCGLVELYDTKRIEDFTEEDWKLTCIPENERMKHGWGWLMRNPRRVVEMPVSGQLGLYKIVVPKGDITEYPRVMKIGEKGFKEIQKRLKK